MHRHTKTILAATVCVATAAIYASRGVTPNIITLAFAEDDGVGPAPPILRSETLNRANNRRRHMNRLYDKMDKDIYDSTLAPLLFDGFIPPAEQATENLQFGSGVTTPSEVFGGRAALSSLARKIDFDSAAGTFPTQSRTVRVPISIWVVGNQADLENRVTGSGYDPGLSGDTVSIDSGVDYLVGDGLVLGLGAGWGSTLGESSKHQLRYRESNFALSPYFVARVTDWLNLRGSVSLGKSTIRQSAIGTVPNDLPYAETIESTTLSNSIGFGSEYEFGVVPLSLSLEGDMITAREYLGDGRATDGGLIAGSTATTRLFDAALEARYRLSFGNHRIIPFAGQEETISLLNQNYGRSGSTRYYVGSDYAYDPLNFDLSIQGFRDLATGSDPVEGVRSEFSLSRDMFQSQLTLQPFVSIESTNRYLDTGGGVTQEWGHFPGQLRFEVRRKLTYEIPRGNYTGLLSIDVPF
ncbi:MAG: autotransporter domain-containing protein [Thalassospira sp.]|uniref:autotransporter domain-containing protein n=1 Tax=Thalassospira sp. TaxID=1912094 RepID=UPI003A8450EB